MQKVIDANKGSDVQLVVPDDFLTAKLPRMPVEETEEEKAQKAKDEKKKKGGKNPTKEAEKQL